MSRRILTFAEAVKLLPEGDTVHTFYNLPNMLVGADWSLAEVLQKLGEEGVRIELTGEKARETGHGMCVHPNKETYYQSEILFIETDPVRLKEVEADG
jgi:hypothetical protein